MKESEILYTLTLTLTPHRGGTSSKFKEIRTYVLSSEAYKDPHSKIEVGEDVIHFGHPLYALSEFYLN